MADLRSELREIIQDDSRIVTEGIEKKYLSDNFQRKRGEADALIFPISTEEVSRLMALAYEKNLPVTPRGAGTNLVGSEGTLAIITKCVLKLIPKPEESLSVLVSFNSLREGIESVREVIKANVNPTAVEFIERDVVKLGEDFLGYEFPEADASAYVLLTFDGSAKEIEAHLDKLKEVAASGGARMQEGLVSLMQMAKVSCALAARAG